MSRKEEDAAVVEAAVPAAVEAAVPAAVPAASLAPGWFPSPVHFILLICMHRVCKLERLVTDFRQGVLKKICI